MDRSQKLSLPLSFSKYASVLLDVALDHPLDYGIPEDKLLYVKKGAQVQVPVKGFLRKGFVLEIKETTLLSKVLPIHSVVTEETPLTEDLFELALWMSKYYLAPLRHVLKNIWPHLIRDAHAKVQLSVSAAKSKEALRAACIQLRGHFDAQAAVLEVLLSEKKEILLTELLEKANVSQSPVDTLVKKGLITVEKVRVDRSPLIGEEYFKTFSKTLNEEQKQAFDCIFQTLNQKIFRTHLLFGVTGSGKTEVYLQAIEKALQMGLGTIMLVPEISLTAQTIERFRARFDQHIAILHHRLSKGERFDEWEKIRKGVAKIVVGARSALFSPVHNLGLIIVDEEHDSAYKQSDGVFCYQARDVAVMRGKICKAAVVLGTATPSIESYANAQSGKYLLAKLQKRPTSFGLPQVTVVDMKKEYAKAKSVTYFSDILIEKLKKRFEVGEQAIVFLNRRGFYTTLLCLGCNHIFKCPHCALALTFHLKEKKISCHLCGFSISPPPSRCPHCYHGEPLKFRGVGTEQIEKNLHALFPQLRTLRMDADTTRHKGSHERLLRAFSTQKADVLIGTQMIAKGLHFPAVTLVAILNCDASLQIPDFRASERVFQLITQVAGRAGRGELQGEVIIQTQMPENPTIQFAAKQDFEGFFKNEMETRKLFDFPPFSHFVKLTFFGPDEKKTEESALLFRKRLIQKNNASLHIHPITPCGYPKIKDFFYFQCLFRSKNIFQINHLLQDEIAKNSWPHKIKIRIDVDPLSTFF